MFKNKYRAVVDYFKKRTELEKFLLIIVSLALFIGFIYALPAILNLLFKMVVLLLIALPITVWFGLRTKPEEVYYDTSKLYLCFKQIVSRLDSDSKNRYIFQSWQEVRASKKKTAKIIEVAVVEYNNVNYLFIRFFLAINENEASSFKKELDVYKAKQETIEQVEDSDFSN